MKKCEISQKYFVINLFGNKHSKTKLIMRTAGTKIAATDDILAKRKYAQSDKVKIKQREIRKFYKLPMTSMKISYEYYKEKV